MMGQTHTVRGRATKVYWLTDNTLNVQYHNTDVVRVYPDGSIRLNTGGYQTATTKLRMNQASNQYRLGYQVYQKAHAWFVDYNGQTIPFTGDTLVLTPDIPPSGLTLSRLTGTDRPEPELGQ
jgi:hypothetical protein